MHHTVDTDYIEGMVQQEAESDRRCALHIKWQTPYGVERKNP